MGQLLCAKIEKPKNVCSNKMVNNSFFININKNYIHSGIIAQSIEVFPKFQEFLKIHNISKCFFSRND